MIAPTAVSPLPGAAACGVRAASDVGRCASRGSTAARIVGVPRLAPSSSIAIDDALDERGRRRNIVSRNKVKRHFQVIVSGPIEFDDDAWD